MKSLSPVRLFATPWTVAHLAPLSMGFSRQEYWSGLPFPSPGDLPNPGIKPGSPALQADALSSEPPRPLNMRSAKAMRRKCALSQQHAQTGGNVITWVSQETMVILPKCHKVSPESSFSLGKQAAETLQGFRVTSGEAFATRGCENLRWPQL